MLQQETIRRTDRVDFYFDPTCPWTWITSRWLVAIARRRGMTISWQPMSLPVLNGGVENMPERFQEGDRLSVRALRMVAAMRRAGRIDLIGRFYTELGTRLHVDGDAPSLDVLQSAAEAAGADVFLVDAGDSRYDADVKESTDRGMALAGPDIGSPVLAIPGHGRGIYGPIISPAPSGAETERLWESLETLLAMPCFYELKHGRSAAPETRPVQLAGAAREA
ncbi:MAG TPA: DsbA family protein [Chloroflexota bacterium]|nr:DsbA family protein [Chloroflexota bacterium]